MDKRYWVYILKSKSTRKFYIGQTSNLETRVAEHNAKRSRYSSSGIPWTLVYCEIYPTHKEAIKRERFLKSPHGWLALQQIKKELESNNFQEQSTANLPI